MDLPIREREQSETTDYDSRRTVNGSLDTGSTPVYSTLPCFDEHLSIKVFKTRIYLIYGIRNPYEAKSEKWQNTYKLSIGGVRKWVKKSYGLDPLLFLIKKIRHRNNSFFQ